MYFAHAIVFEDRKAGVVGFCRLLILAGVVEDMGAQWIAQALRQGLGRSGGEGGVAAVSSLQWSVQACARTSTPPSAVNSSRRSVQGLSTKVGRRKLGA
ncbi:hypothetical protein G6O69_09195 [Pseudenhygromyxa sp. WMMC2535]|uniref:hypothetical protein n=1 Tax=Pseudenhygromyxa sp. WMMC2535 TaxID=2712867 RepID=UPI001555F124|nr:hypothetical protein [Pseudenhygromyxa sp. WMMC2535]NVB38006.1 hypothetical protein [Pseudenhygromyxa sp. WMMC2535]